MAPASACQPFQEGKQRQQHLPLRHGDGSVLPPVYRGAVLPLRQAGSAPPPPPPAAQEPPLSSGRSVTEAQALKVHSEAERRRRERINAHLAALRMMIPDARQMDKATLLARVVRQLKDLKRKAAETTPPLHIPAEANSVTVDCYTGAAAVGYGRPVAYVRASVSCDDRPGLLADLAGEFRRLRLKPLRADVSSLGGRARCEFMLCGGEEGDTVTAGRVKALEEGVRQALANAACPEMAYGCNYRSRRQRVLESHYVLGHGLDVDDHGW
ncbi:hypothetical protein BAE44_0006946 [Dichanthelium oligosanthes]|uniref:BHLH domain-containing protein n=1 Tax=Dichanthelium oligosanthes TaxID=888268 RepID=A0A1E5W3S1_9POAL|nr:hypothetical protein BAE44_0006946 [Dichanthelium oligosanthes]